ncbi:MAG TPA: ABC transporter ATP-binding protein, partial [Bacillota bacterium]|nr:ABC transporter ATP-binding protein [Bacillota bacterium]
AMMLGITAIGASGAIGRNFLASHVSQRFGRDLRLDLYKKIQQFSFANIDQFDTASLVTRLTNDVTQVQNFANGVMRIFVKAPLLCIGSLIMATMQNPSLAIILLMVVPLISVLIFISMRIGYPFFMKVQQALDRVNGVMREYLSGVRVVKAFNRFEYETDRFAGANQELAATSTKAMRVMACFSPGISLSVNLGIIAVLWFGGIKVNNGSMHVGQVIAFISYMTLILFSLTMISFIFNQFVRARASSERIGEVFSAKNTMMEAAVPLRTTEIKGCVEFDRVDFSYVPGAGEPILKGITFAAEPGQTIGIIGSTGAGKSTLVNLIPRFYDPTSGSVRVGGVNVQDLDIRELRERIAVVPQKTVLLTGSILDNIRWGRENASRDQIEQAAAIARAHDFISSFPEGYDTLLGQGGVNLSGGQKQRISIARALVRRPEILILDDSASAVDVVTEAAIRDGLREYSRDLTCFIITQRITSVMRTDKILVLDAGVIVGAGKHEELMKNCTVYQEIFRSQIGKEDS